MHLIIIFVWFLSLVYQYQHYYLLFLLCFVSFFLKRFFSLYHFQVIFINLLKVLLEFQIFEISKKQYHILLSLVQIKKFIQASKDSKLTKHMFILFKFVSWNFKMKIDSQVLSFLFLTFHFLAFVIIAIFQILITIILILLVLLIYLSYQFYIILLFY